MSIAATPNSSGEKEQGDLRPSSRSSIGAVQVAICICTYRRPDGLRRVLRSLSALKLESHPMAHVTIVVVDNDAEGDSALVVDEAAAYVPFPIRVNIEPRRGISHARNRCVALASGCDLIAFIDDDETAEPDWLSALLSTMEQFHADVVTGPVLSVFESTPPQWILDGRFLDRDRFRTGAELETAKTGNVLIRKSLLDHVNGPFDHRFALTGGEDALLFMQLQSMGARLVWCDEAVVNEVIAGNRLNVKWTARRAFRLGNTITRCERIVNPAARGSFARAAKALGKIVIGIAAFPIRAPRGRAGAASSLRDIAYGIGCLVGFTGYGYQEYRDA